MVNITSPLRSSTNKIIAFWKDGSNSYDGTSAVGTVSGTSISFASSTVFADAAGSTDSIFATFDSNSNKAVVAYYNSGFKASVFGFESTDLTSENFVGITNAAYATGQTATIQAGGAVNTGQPSLTAGQQYFVQIDGTLGLTAADPSVIAGTAVSATDLIVKG